MTKATDPSRDHSPDDLPEGYDETLAHKARSLMSAGAVLTRAECLLDRALGPGLEHVSVDPEALDPAVDEIERLIRERWGDLVLPFNSVWRRFEAGGHDRFAGQAASRQWADVREMGRAAFDMALVTGFLGISAPGAWAFADAFAAERYRGADGLAIAGLSMISSGLFSGVPLDPLRADAGQLARLDTPEIETALQVEAGSGRIDCEARARGLRRLGEAANLRDDLFAREDDPRPGGLFDLLFEEGLAGPLTAGRILEVLADGLAPVFAGGLDLGAIPLGDTYRHGALSGEGIDPQTAGLLPLHGRLQRLVVDLAEPLVWAGIEISGLEELTAQSDPVAVSLLLDTGVMRPRVGEGDLSEPDISAPVVVEMRGLSVALFDRLASRLRVRFEAEPAEMPLAGLLEGGIRHAAGKIALEKRATAAPALLFAGADTLL